MVRAFFNGRPTAEELVVVSRTGPSDNVAASARKSDVRHYSHISYKFNDTGWYDDKRSHLFVVDAAGGAATQTHFRRRLERYRSAVVARFHAHRVRERPHRPGVRRRPQQRRVGDRGRPAARSLKSQIMSTTTRSRAGRPTAGRSHSRGRRRAGEAPKLYLAPASGGGKSTLAVDGLDLIPTDLHWGPGAQELRFETGYKGTNQVFRVDLAARKVSPGDQGRARVSRLRLQSEGRRDDVSRQRFSAPGRSLCGGAGWQRRTQVDASECRAVGATANCPAWSACRTRAATGGTSTGSS